MQINSFEDLKKRAEDSQEVALKLKERLTQTVETMNLYKKTCDDDIKSKLEDANKQNELISKKLIQVFGKFEEYLSNANGRGIMKAEHDSLNDKYQSSINEIQDPRLGLLKKLRDLQTRVRIGTQTQGSLSTNTMRMRLEAQGKTSESLADEMTTEDLKDLFSILRG